MTRRLATAMAVACTGALLAVAPSAAWASAGLGVSVPAEKAVIAATDPEVHWAKPSKQGAGALDYSGVGDRGNAAYELIAVGSVLWEVEATVRASTEAEGIKLGEVQDAIAGPFAGKPEVGWYEDQVRLAQAGSFQRATKVFGKVRVGLAFSRSGATLVLNVAVQPTHFG